MQIRVHELYEKQNLPQSLLERDDDVVVRKAKILVSSSSDIFILYVGGYVDTPSKN